MDASARLTTLTRVGFAARGLLYIVIAVLIIQSGRTEDPSGALGYLADGAGIWLLALMAAGFIAYGIWRLSDAALNIEHHEENAKGLRQRLGAAGSGVVHLLLAWQAVKLVQGAGSDGGNGAQENAQTALQLPGGQLMLIIAGLVLMGAGAFQLYKAYKTSFCEKLEPGMANREWVKILGRVGYSARGVVFLISGYFIFKAGMEEQSGEAGGMEEALAWLTNPWDLVVAIGLLMFGLFSLIEARYRVIHSVPVDGLAHQARSKLPL